MSDVSAKKVNFANREVQAASALIDALEDLHALRAEWDALGYASAIEDTDLTGPVAHIAAADLAAAFTTLEALDTLLAAGHYTNLYKLTL